VQQVYTDWLTVGDFRDTMPALDGVAVVRFVADRFTGEIVVHCHALMHEDRGLMDTFLIVASGATPSPTTVTTTTVAATTTTTAAPSSASLLSATAAMLLAACFFCFV
jgi:hypothetical protein